MFTALVILAATLDQPTIQFLRTPESGLQPQAALAADGTLHLLYYKGHAHHGDLFYTTRAPGKTTFADAIQVNSIAGAACAVGNMRGGQIALGKDVVHIVWNGSQQAAETLAESGKPRHGGEPLLYTRLKSGATAFESERDIITKTTDLDGGGSIVADGAGRVYIVWHAALPETASKGEIARQVFIATSTDAGATFSAESAISPPGDPLGACGCCGLKVFAEGSNIAISFRAAGEKVHRDQHLLRSTDQGHTFTDTLLNKWQVQACPMSTASIIGTPSGPILAWESENNVYWSPAANISPISPSGKPNHRKFPSIARNAKGEVLLAWTEGMTFGNPGTLHWQVYDAAGKPMEGAAGTRDDVPSWSLVATVAESDGSFAIIY